MSTPEAAQQIDEQVADHRFERVTVNAIRIQAQDIGHLTRGHVHDRLRLFA